MALIKCYKCGCAISDKADICPKCGAPARISTEQQGSGVESKDVSQKKKTGFIFLIVAVVLIILLVVFAIFRTRMISIISVEKNEIFLGIGEEKAIKYEIYPSFASTKNLEWNSDDQEVALVDKGLITGVGEGTTIVSVESPNGKKGSCTVTVASLVDEWEWNFTYIDGTKYTSDDFSSKFWVNENTCGFTDAMGDTYTGTWKYEGALEGIDVYFFDADGSLDFNITISENSLTVSPELSNKVVVFFDRK